MKILLILGSVCFLAVGAVAVAVGVIVLRLRGRNAPAADDTPAAERPLFDPAEWNRDGYNARQQAALDALSEGDPLREWVARGADLGWLGFRDFLFGLMFDDDEPFNQIAPVRALRYATPREPDLRALPSPDAAFGVDLTNVFVSDRALEALAAHPNLAALDVGGKSDVTDASLKKHVARMTGLVALNLRSTGVTGRGLRHLRDLPALRYLSVSFIESGYFADAVEHLREMRQLLALGTSSIAPVSDADLRALAPLEQLTHLELAESIPDAGGLTNAGLKHLRPFGRLTVLSVRSSAVTDAGLAEFRALGALQKLTLGLSEGKFRGPGLAGLVGMDALRELDLSHNTLTAAGLEHFAGLAGLRTLKLAHNPITDAGLARLRLPPALDELDLCQTRATDKGVAALQLPPSVTRLSLQSVPVTDASIPHLARFTGLLHLNLVGTKFTRAGAQRLSEALPYCEITTPFPK